MMAARGIASAEDSVTNQGVYRIIEPDEVVRFSLPDETVSIVNISGRTVETLSTSTPLQITAVSPPRRGRPRIEGGWVTSAVWDHGGSQPLIHFATTWPVPDPPVVHGNQRIYFFPCLHDGTSNRILQPILEWSEVSGDGEQSWTVSSWYITSEPELVQTLHFMTPVTPVRVGDLLTGVISAVPTGNGNVDYVCEFAGIPDSRLAIENVGDLKTAKIALESWKVGEGKCDEFPSTPTVPFTSIELFTAAEAPALNWSIENQNDSCGHYAVVVDGSNPGGAIDIRR